MFRLLLIVGVICFCSPNLFGQQKSVEEFADRYEKMFAKRPPLLNSTLSDAEAFDEDGKPFELSQTRGKFTVFVFGCLT